MGAAGGADSRQGALEQLIATELCFGHSLSLGFAADGRCNGCGGGDVVSAWKDRLLRDPEGFCIIGKSVRCRPRHAVGDGSSSHIEHAAKDTGGKRKNC